MEKYKLSVNLIKKASTENHPITINIEGSIVDIERYCIKICTQGFITDDGYGLRFIPSHRIEDIDIEKIEN